MGSSLAAAPQHQHFVNGLQDVVTESLDGLVAGTPHLSRLDGYPGVRWTMPCPAGPPHRKCATLSGRLLTLTGSGVATQIKVVVDATHDRRRVALVSGASLVLTGTSARQIALHCHCGGSGHEPAHAGYVGPGMLTAAVAGEVFASPTAAAVLAALRAVTGPAGTLLIVKNYTGDRLHFSIAAERAKAEGLKVEMLVVDDDCALPPKRITGRRGVAGTVLVHKVAGAAAAGGMSLERVKDVAEAALRAMGTMGVALSGCTLPGAAPSDRVAAGTMELGLGIHGEPGTRTAPLQPADGIVEEVLSGIMHSVAHPADSRPVRPGARVALLVNSLGGTPALELGVVAAAAVRLAKQRHQLAVERLYVGPLMTALDMMGFSLTLLEVDDGRLELLDAPTEAPGWPRSSSVCHRDKQPIPVPTGPADASQPSATGPTAADGGEATRSGQLLGRCIGAAADALIANATRLDELDRAVGDGDCGSTLATAARAVKQDLAQYPLGNPAATLAALGETVAASTGGTSGALYEIMLTATAAALRTGEATPSGWATAAAAGAAAVSRYSGAAAGDRTMLDAILPAVDALRAGGGDDPGTAASAAVGAARDGAEATRSMSAAAGRASYVSEESLADNPDPGAMAVAVWLEAVSEALQ